MPTKERRRRAYHERRATGQCVECGRSNDRPKVRCSRCATAQRARARQKLTGCSTQQYAYLLSTQGGMCAICEHSPRQGELALSADHEHSTGRIRGLLCRSCNLGLGFFKDNADCLRRASRYVKGLWVWGSGTLSYTLEVVGGDLAVRF